MEYLLVFEYPDLVKPLLACTFTINKYAMPVQVDLLQTLSKANHPNWCTTSQSRRHFWFSSSMLILRGGILALMVPRLTSLHAVACQDLHPWNPSSTLTPKTLLMKIQLCYGFCHTVVLDKDGNFFGVCRIALDLLHINCHVLSGNIRNLTIVKHVNRYLMFGLKIMTNERKSVHVALEATLLLLYAWNSCPITGTDISRSLVAAGPEFAFPINYPTNKH
jgi:hypothetical protein